MPLFEHIDETPDPSLQNLQKGLESLKIVTKVNRRYPDFQTMKKDYSDYLSTGKGPFKEQGAMLSSRFDATDENEEDFCLSGDQTVAVKLNIKDGVVHRVGVSELLVTDLASFFRSGNSKPNLGVDNLSAEVSMNKTVSNDSVIVSECSKEKSADNNAGNTGNTGNSSVVCSSDSVRIETVNVVTNTSGNVEENVTSSLSERTRNQLRNDFHKSRNTEDLRKLINDLKGLKTDGLKSGPVPSQPTSVITSPASCTVAAAEKVAFSISNDLKPNDSVYPMVEYNFEENKLGGIINREGDQSQGDAAEINKTMDDTIVYLEGSNSERSEQKDTIVISERNEFDRANAEVEKDTNKQAESNIERDSESVLHTAECGDKNRSVMDFSVKASASGNRKRKILDDNEKLHKEGLAELERKVLFRGGSSVSRSSHSSDTIEMQNELNFSLRLSGLDTTSDNIQEKSESTKHTSSQASAIEGIGYGTKSGKRPPELFYGKPMASSIERRIIPFNARISVTDEEVLKDPRVQYSYPRLELDLPLPQPFTSNTKSTLNKKVVNKSSAQSVNEIDSASEILSQGSAQNVATDTIERPDVVHISDIDEENTQSESEVVEAKFSRLGRLGESVASDVYDLITVRSSTTEIESEIGSSAEDDHSRVSEIRKLRQCRERAISTLRKVHRHARRMLRALNADNWREIEKRIKKINTHAEQFLERYDDDVATERKREGIDWDENNNATATEYDEDDYADEGAGSYGKSVVPRGYWSNEEN